MTYAVQPWRNDARPQPLTRYECRRCAVTWQGDELCWCCGLPGRLPERQPVKSVGIATAAGDGFTLTRAAMEAT